MREIKFRGKWLDNGEWLFGDIAHHDDRVSYIGQHPIDGAILIYPLDPETVGQYTGLTDKNGKEIYEGDILLATLKFFDIVNEKCKVIFHNGSFGVQYGFSVDYFKSISTWDEVTVIGNIHDNPELLK
mgnify:CR=1 FL=1